MNYIKNTINFLGLLSGSLFLVGCNIRFGDDASSSLTKNSEQECENILVTKVVDGDTFKTEAGDKVRMIGIDTPETQHPSKGMQYYGYEAYKYLDSRIENQIVCLQKPLVGDEVDIYDRQLRYVVLSGVNINRELIEKGYATVYENFDFAYKDEYLELQKVAKSSELGIRNIQAEEEWKKYFDNNSQLEKTCKSDENVICDSEVYDNIGKTVTVRYQIKNIGWSDNYVLLNSNKNYNTKTNFVTLIDRDSVTESEEDNLYKMYGKVINVEGELIFRNGKAQIVVEVIYDVNVLE